MSENKYQEQLHEQLVKYVKAPSSSAFTGFLTAFFLGVKENAMLPVRFFVDCDEMNAGYQTSEHVDGAAFEVFTEKVDVRVATENKLRAIIREMDKNEACTGIMFNPRSEYEVFVPKKLIRAAIGAGYQISMDEIEAEAELYAQNNSEHDLIWQRPVDEEVFSDAAERIQAFDEHTDDFLKISFLEDRDILFAQILRTGTQGERHLSFGYDMDDFGWDKPLVLGKELPVEEVISILKRICVDDVSTDDIEEIMHFKSMG